MFFTTVVVQGIVIFSSSYPAPFIPFTCTEKTDFFQKLGFFKNFIVKSML